MEDNKTLDFLRKHWSKLVLGVLVLACAAVWGERFSGKKRSRSQQDFLIANQILERFYKGEPLAVESIEVTENILKRHPELHPKLDAMLSSTFFSQSKPNKGIDYAQTTLDHVKTELAPLYQSYAETSLLIAKNQYAEALTAAQSLNQKLKDQADYEHLQLMNLLRLVFLAKELDEQELQQTAWEQLTKHPKFAALESVFHEGKLTLYDYIQD